MKNWKIIKKYARIRPSGYVIKCTPSQDELSGVAERRAHKGGDYKVIYDTREAADACGKELESVGLDPQRPYPCTRSRKGHWHLTHDSGLVKHRWRG